MKTKNQKRNQNVKPQKAVPVKAKPLTRAEKTRRMVITGILTALVLVLGWLSTFLKVGTVPVTLTLIPIVIGAALCGTKSAVWLGFVFSCTALYSTFMDPFSYNLFIVPNIGGTFITIFAKGMFSGLAAASVYKAVEKRNKYLAVFAAGIVCPVVNTGIFLIGCVMFFFQGVSNMASGAGQNVFLFMILSFVGINFLVELLVNMVLSPAIVRLLNIRKKA